MNELEADLEQALDDASSDLTHAVFVALGVFERLGFSAKVADDFVRECVFQAWMNFDYQPRIVVR